MLVLLLSSTRSFDTTHGHDSLSCSPCFHRNHLEMCAKLVSANCQIVNGARRHRVTVRRSAGFPDAVVWNPWVDKAKSTADFGDEEYRVGLLPKIPALCDVQTFKTASPLETRLRSMWHTRRTLHVRQCWREPVSVQRVVHL